MQSLFVTTDEVYHAKLRRAVSNAYAMSTLVKFEPLVDSTTEAFLYQLKQRYADRADDSGKCDFGKWLQYYAFDVIGKHRPMLLIEGVLTRQRGIDILCKDWLRRSWG